MLYGYAQESTVVSVRRSLVTQIFQISPYSDSSLTKTQLPLLFALIGELTFGSLLAGKPEVLPVALFSDDSVGRRELGM